MKRLARVTAALLLAVGLVASPAAAAEPPIHVLLQGSQVQFDAEPFVENNRTLVPIRALSERLGFTVGWVEAEQKITLTKGADVVILWIGKTEASVNGKPFTLDVAPKIQRDRTFVPLRFISEHLGAKVYWDGANRHVRVTPKGQSDPDALVWLNATPAAPLQKTQTKGEFRFSMTEPSGAPVEMIGSMQFHAVGKEMLGEVALMAPVMGAQVPVGNLQIANRDGFTWMKMTGAMAGEGAPAGWQPIGPSVGAEASAAMAVSPEQLSKLITTMKDQIHVTFGQAEPIGTTEMVRLEIDLGDLQFGQLLSEFMGEGIPTAEMPAMDATLSMLLEAESKNPRAMTMDATVSAPPGEQGSMTIHMQFTINPTELAITWPADLPAAPPTEHPDNAQPGGEAGTKP